MLSRTHLFAAVVSACTFLSCALATQAHAARFTYLRDAMKEITQINHAHTQLTQDDAGRIAKIACEALTKLINDPDLKPTLNALDNERFRRNRASANALLRSLQDFNNEFVTIERTNLRDLGYDPQSINDMLDQATRTRATADASTLTAATVEAALRSYQTTVCQAAIGLVTQQQADDARRKVLAAALIIGDAAGEVLTGGVGTAPVAASIAIGIAVAEPVLH